MVESLSFSSGNTPYLWDTEVVKIADSSDQSALIRAGQISALAHIGRSIYTALLEQMCANEGLAQGTPHCEHLEEVMEKCREAALHLHITALKADLPTLSDSLTNILVQTQEWLKNRRPVLGELHEPYAKQEVRRKGSRARLPMTEGARLKRAEWAQNVVPLAEPLHYRWNTVWGLLADLEVR